jgi:hypothetical protein
LSAFIDQFGETSGLKYSICERDFKGAMQGIGNAIAKRLQNLCVDEKLYNTKFATVPAPANPDELGADCRVVLREQVVTDNVVTWQESGKSMKKCKAGAENGKVDENCWQVTIDKDKCKVNGQLIKVLRTAKDIAERPVLPDGTKVGMQCRTCPDATTIENLDHESESYRACSYKPF